MSCRIVIECDDCCTRSKFPPDRPTLIVRKEDDMDFKATLSPVNPAEQVTRRTLTITPDDGSSPTTITLGPDVTEFVFSGDPNPGHTAAVTAVDGNAVGDSGPSNTVVIDLSPLPPGPPTSVPSAPTLTVVPVGPVTGNGNSFRRK